MKKNNVLLHLARLRALAMAGLVCLTATMVSCNRNQNIDDMEVLYPGMPSEVTVNRLGGQLTVPVNMTGHWTAELQTTTDGTVWAAVVSPEGQDCGKVELTVDYMSPRLSQQERTAILVIKGEHEQHTVQVRQYMGITFGETVANADNEPFYDLWYNRGMGSGFDPLTGKQSINMVLNMSGLRKIMANVDDPEVLTLFSQQKAVGGKTEMIFTDTLETNEVGLGVQATIDVQYALFKVSLKVDYDNKGMQLVNTKTYNVSQKIVSLKSATDVPSLRAIITGNPLNSTKVQSILTAGFLSQYRKIMAAYDNFDDKAFRKEVQRMLADYGPVMVSGAELGGSLFLSIMYDAEQAEKNFDVKGSVKLDMMLGPIGLKAGVSAEYQVKGKDLWQNSRHYISCGGGDQKALSHLCTLLTDDEPVRKNVVEAVQTWGNSIMSSQDHMTDNTKLVTMAYTPLWNLFPREVASEMKPIVVEYYEGKKLCISDVKSLGIW